MFIIFCVPLPSVCAGNAVGLAVTAAGFFLTFYSEEVLQFIAVVWQSGAGGKTAVIICSLVILTAVIYCIYLSIKMQKAAKNVPDPDKVYTVIVLGCKVKNGRPTRMLRRRLNAAIEYLRKSSESVCIVSGGQGSDEICSEAFAMKEYLIGKGIDKERIYTEDRSTDTAENLNFSLKIVQTRKLPESIAIATDGFHQYRASLIAARMGINVKAISSQTEPRYAPTYYVREWLALAALKCK